MENKAQNIKLVNRLMLVKESNEMSGWNDTLAEIIRDVHRSLEKAGKEAHISDKGMEKSSEDVTDQMDDFSL